MDAPTERIPTDRSIGLSKETIECMRRSHEKLVSHSGFSKINEEAPRLFSGAGIVTTAGGSYFPPLLLNIRMLRRTNSTLPVQVFLRRNEYDETICETVLPELNAACLVIDDYLRPDHPVELGNFQLKVFSILFSIFEKILFLDSDNVPVYDPAELLYNEPFVSRGFVSWPDFWIATEDPAFYTIAGLDGFPKGMPGKSSEAGQLLVNKATHLQTLILAAYYNVYGPDYYYSMFTQGADGEGDKETFLAAAIVLGASFYRVKHDVEIGGKGTYGGQYDGTSMLQFHPGDEYMNVRSGHPEKEPRLLFIHAHLPKMDVGGLVTNPILVDEKRVRIWGPAEGMVKMTGQDVEKAAWQEMVVLACEYQNKVSQFRELENLCAGAQEHYKDVFDKSATFGNGTPSSQRGVGLQNHAGDGPGNG